MLAHAGRVWLALVGLVLGTAVVVLPVGGAAAAVPAGFTDEAVLGGLSYATAVDFAPDGRVVVAEKRGVLKIFDGPGDITPAELDLRTDVENYWDRGLLGIALDPDWATSPYVYLLYAYDAPPGGSAPHWGTAGVDDDPCPVPADLTHPGCVVQGRLARVRLGRDGAGATTVGSPAVLLQGWCQQFPSHSVGDLAFGPDGYLYVSGGEGAGFLNPDYGQNGGNPCADPVDEGGSLRAQSVRRTAGPVLFSGSVLRVDKATGDAAPGNPSGLRSVAYGMRNPYRIAVQPGSGDLYVGDVGWDTYEEIDRVPAGGATAPRNYGWPCYEGPDRQAVWDALDKPLCESLYAAGPSAVVAPAHAYSHAAEVVPGDGCGTGSSAVTGVAFHGTGGYPAAYDNALFFVDGERHCIWSAPAGAFGRPDFSRLTTFAHVAGVPIDLTTGPGGDLYYLDAATRTVHRIGYTGGPTASLAVDQAYGGVPLTVHLDASASRVGDPAAGPLSYAWDLDGDKVFTDATGATATSTYGIAGPVTVSVHVTDALGRTDTASVRLTPGDQPPAIAFPTVQPPPWEVGHQYALPVDVTDPEDGAVPASAVSAEVVLLHCPTSPTDCHEHPQPPPTETAGADGTVTYSFVAPDHTYPSKLALRVTATDSAGLAVTQELVLAARGSTLELATAPSGLTLAVGATTVRTPRAVQEVVGSRTTVTAPAVQTLSGTTYRFRSWSDGGARSHEVVAPEVALRVTATYAADPPPRGLVAAYGFNEGRGKFVGDLSGGHHSGLATAPIWTAGWHGGALAFDGRTTSVSVADAPALHVTTGLTIEAWVCPTTAAGWRTIALKQRGRDNTWALFAADNGRPAGHVVAATATSASGPTALPLNHWTHLTTTYDETRVRLFVNGTQVASAPVRGPLLTSTGALRIGGSLASGQYFAGRLDDVRIYQRALGSAEVRYDMGRPVT